MSGYLQRALSRGFGIAKSGNALRPFVRSTSPIADRDQRLGMPGLEAFELAMVEGPLEGDDRRAIGQSPTLPERPDAATVSRPVSASHPATLRASAPEPCSPREIAVTTRKSPTHEAASGERPDAGREDPEEQIEARPRRRRRSPAAASEPEAMLPPVPKQPSRTPGERPAVEFAPAADPWVGNLPQPTRPESADGVPGIGSTPLGSGGPDGNPEPEVAADANRDPVPVKVFSTPVDTATAPKLPGAPPVDGGSPSPGYVPQGRDFGDVGTAADSPSAPVPRLVIGEVNVEVVKQTAPTPAAPRVPATAAGVSQIGPLSTGPGARRLLGLRGR